MNIYGTPLEPCRQDNVDRRGSWDAAGKCSDRGAADPGVHQLCFRVTERTQNFSTATGQSAWSRERVNRNHCMCLGAFALYKARQEENAVDDTPIPRTSDELLCHAIPETALSDRYLRNWSIWNNYEHAYELGRTYTHALRALCTQCDRDARTESERLHLKQRCEELDTGIVDFRRRLNKSKLLPGL